MAAHATVATVPAANLLRRARSPLAISYSSSQKCLAKGESTDPPPTLNFATNFRRILRLLAIAHVVEQIFERVALRVAAVARVDANFEVLPLEKYRAAARAQ